ncbi:uncharacterized protein METZ01_LOCUS393355, partial [marine metagenome]
MDIIETLILVGIFSVIGFVNDKTKPQKYYYEDRIVTVYKKYQCPKYCEVDHYHYVYYDSTIVGHGNMCIDKDKLG